MSPDGRADARRALHRLQAAFGTNALGAAAGTIALPLFVIETTGSLAATGILLGVAMAGLLVAGAVVGPWVDRCGLLVSAQVAVLAGSLITGAIVVLHLLGLLTFPVLLVLSFLRATADPPAAAAVGGLIPPLARRAEIRLERANSVLRLIRAVCDLTGPVVAGGVIATVGTEVVLAVDAVLGLVAAVMLFALGRSRTLTGVVPRPGGGGAGSWRADTRAGLSILRRDPTLRVLVLSSAALAAVDLGLITIALTDYAVSVLDDPATFGLLVSGFGLGTLVGTLLYGLAGHHLPRRATFLLAYAAVALVIGTLGVAAPGVWGAVGLLVVVGLVIAPLDNLYVSVMQERVPASHFGRVSVVVATVVSAPAPVSVPAMAAFVLAVGLRPALVAIGALYLLMVLALLALRPLRDLDTTRAPAPGPAASRSLTPPPSPSVTPPPSPSGPT